MPLTDTACRNAKSVSKPTKISDGAGLYLLVQPTGSKLWRMNYRYGGKQKTLALGKYPQVSLLDARNERERAKELLAAGSDPSKIRKAEKAEATLNNKNTFEFVGREWFDINRKKWTPEYADRLIRRLEADIFPNIGSRPIADIQPPELLAQIRKVESRGAVVLAKRLLQVCGQIFRYSVATGRVSSDPSRDLKGALQPPVSKRHRAALSEAELPAFLSDLESYEGEIQTKLALKLVVHTFLRTSEIRFGRWGEIEGLNTKSPLWRIPAERMKMRSEHLVPLSPQCADILSELKTLAGSSDYILPAKTKAGVISQNTLIYALYRLGYHSRATVHGFRRTASTILNERGFNRDWIERQLAHCERNDVRDAYNAAEWLADRREMMCWWSIFLCSSKR